MKILFIADGRSPISRNWIRYFAERGDEVTLASTFACDVEFPLKRLEFTPVAFSAVKKNSRNPRSGFSRMLRLGSAQALGLRTVLRQWLGPLTISHAAGKLRALIEEIKPDLIHAMRIPYEGMLAADAYTGTPLVISVWGNDFTLHAPSTPWMKHYTQWTMKVADTLHADCQRDIRLAHEWGFGNEKPTLIMPGNGGIRMDVFYPPQEPVEAPIILNPRGFRAYIRNDAFFKAIPLVLSKRADARFICSSMAGEPQAIQWVRELGIDHAVQLDPPLPHTQMADVFRSAQVVVSTSIHDGTPNSLLEGMACGCFPVAGDLESIREWITPGQNGLLVNSANPQSIADAILIALEREDLRREAAGLNSLIIASRAEYARNMQRVGEFYEKILPRNS